jgi:hypothetical protein
MLGIKSCHLCSIVSTVHTRKNGKTDKPYVGLGHPSVPVRFSLFIRGTREIE